MANFDMQVTEYMSSPAETIPVGSSLVEADARMTASGISALAVLDADGRTVGVISRTDLLHAAQYTKGQAFVLPERPIEELMMSPAVVVSPSDKVSTAARAMVKNRVHRVFVTGPGGVEGVLSTRDLMRAVADKRLKTAISEIAASSIVKVQANDTIAMASDRLEVSNKQGLVVVDGPYPVGIFDQRCALDSRRLPHDTPVDQVMDVRFLVLPPGMGLGRAAAQAIAMNTRRILIEDELGVSGIVGGLDFAKVMSA